jgi:hypothetical protein
MLAALTLLSAQGCTSAGTSADASAAAGSTTNHPVVSPSDAAQQFSFITRQIDVAAAAADQSQALTLVTGAAWAQATGQYTAQASVGTPVPSYTYSDEKYYVPVLSQYPEWFVVQASRRLAGSGQAGAAADTLLLFSKQRAALPWTLSGQTVLSQPLPAVTMSHGYAISVSTTDSQLLLRPDVAGATQAAVVDEGTANPSAALVAGGTQTTGLYTAQSRRAHSAASQNLDYSWLMAGSTFPQVGLRLQDGGALILYGMYLNTTLEHPGLAQGSPLPVPAGFSALFAAPTEVGYHEVLANWTYQFAAIDPAASASGARLQVIAAQGSPSYGHAY